MARPNRGKQARATARALAEHFGLRAVEARYDDYGDGPAWYLNWSNGPTYTTMQAALDDLAPQLAPDVGRWRLSRVVQDDALAVQAVRLALAGQLHPGGSPNGQIETACHTTDDPDRPVDEREAAMARRLLEATGGSRMGELLQERGLAWLLPRQDTRPREDADARVDEPQTALEVLTARYAVGEARRRWERQTITLPVQDAVEAALADPDTPGTCINAALTLLPVLRAGIEARLDATEKRAMAAARQRGRSWSQIGRRMGISAQAAQQRAARRADR